MRLCCFLAICYATIIALPLLAQPQVADTQKAPQSQPAVPQAYQLDIRNVLAYQVVVTNRAGAAPPTTTKYREMVLFDVDGDDNLIAYIGSPDTKAATTPASPAPVGVVRTPEKRPSAAGGEHRPAAPPVEHKAAPAPERKPNVPEEAEKITLTWTRHVLGKDFTRGADGMISFRPPEGQVMPYPVLPLPPTSLKEKERFELTVPDLALGQGKTLQVSGLAKVGQDGKLTVDCRVDAKIVPGTMPELGILGYDIPASASAVSGIRMTRRPASEPAGAPAGQEPAEPRPRGEKSQQPRPTPPAAGPTTSVIIQLVSSKPAPEELRKGLISQISTGSHSGSEPAAGEQSAAGERPAADSSGKPARVTGNLWEQVDQLGAQSRERNDAGK